MLIEPTETESKAELDRFIEAMRLLAGAAKAGDVERFKGAPFHAPLRRLDETRAARSPRLRWAARKARTARADRSRKPGFRERRVFPDTAFCISEPTYESVMATPPFGLVSCVY